MGGSIAEKVVILSLKMLILNLSFQGEHQFYGKLLFYILIV